ncbi:HAD-IA family hydrolase [Vibrio alginolyticus]|uniref:HAD-IA family hydrolase n=1 Tax=Vibrio alginolyticus TaxID=663 RepID=UPI0025556476|nr:HAD-IA family hydrolase [Vibrio alginolyticus]MDL0442605.1 HAD-IA family hydrolase [Vibrio alginolyticus]
MTKVDAVLFDLDDTLVSTSRLQAYREGGDREGLKENLSQSKLFGPVNDILKAVKDAGIPLGLITNSPKWYTDEVLRYHDIDIFDVTICYDDVGHDGIKPSDKGIRLALEKLNLTSRANVIYVGDQETDYIASYIAGVKPIAPSWAKRDPIGQIPAAIVNSETLIGNLSNYDELSLIADRTASNRAFNFPKKQMSFIPLNEKGELVPLRKEEVKLIAFGRYFSQSSTLTARLHENHALSKDIVAKELSETYIVPEFYVDLMARVVETLPLWALEEGKVFDIITVIPSKKNKNPRLENMLNRIAKKSLVKSEFISDLFEFSAGAESLKTLGGKERRMSELEAHLSVKQKYKEHIVGKTVLVIDDVITTGSTFTHAFNLLETGGADYAFGACLAKTVSVREDAKLCPDCGKLMKVRTQKSTGIHFYGCTGFFEKINRCDYAESIIVKECPQCGDGLVTKSNRTTGEHFLACQGYTKAQHCMYKENLEEV